MATKKKNNKPRSINIQNRKASFNYHILDKYEAGIVLSGTEIKSIKDNKASLVDSHCYLARGELWVINLYIAPYTQGNIYNHDERRKRKLLLHRKELNKLIKTKEKGFTIIPLRLYVNQRGFAKLQIALAKGKQLYDKRQAIKERDLERERRRGEK